MLLCERARLIAGLKAEGRSGSQADLWTAGRDKGLGTHRTGEVQHLGHGSFLCK